jgi:hypothetical protein
LATAANAARINACPVQRQTLLDAHFVLPGVAEVVFVAEPFVDAKTEVGEADSFCIGREANTADLADAVIPARLAGWILISIGSTSTGAIWSVW